MKNFPFTEFDDGHAYDEIEAELCGAQPTAKLSISCISLSQAGSPGTGT